MDHNIKLLVAAVGLTMAPVAQAATACTLAVPYTVAERQTFCYCIVHEVPSQNVNTCNQSPEWALEIAKATDKLYWGTQGAGGSAEYFATIFRILGR